MSNNHVFLIGICGNSGAGKSTVQGYLSDLLGDELLCLDGDGDHKWERGDEKWKEYTHLDPRANYLYRQAEDLCQLKNGETVRRVDYDHETGKFTPEREVSPRPFISFSGLHALYLPQQREVMDLKIYVKADEPLRLFWKQQRDTTMRGYTMEEVSAQESSRTEDAQRYIYPQEKYAEIVLRNFEEENEVGVEIAIKLAVDLEPVVKALLHAGVRAEYDPQGNSNCQVLKIHPSGCHESINFSKIFYQIFPHGCTFVTKPFTAVNAVECATKLVLLQGIVSKWRGDGM